MPAHDKLRIETQFNLQLFFCHFNYQFDGFSCYGFSIEFFIPIFRESFFLGKSEIKSNIKRSFPICKQSKFSTFKYLNSNNAKLKMKMSIHFGLRGKFIDAIHFIAYFRFQLLENYSKIQEIEILRNLLRNLKPQKTFKHKP